MVSSEQAPPEVRVRVGCEPATVNVSLCDAPANPVPFSGVRVMTYVAGARSAPVSRRPSNVMLFGPFLPATVSRPVGTVRVHCGLPMLPRVGATHAPRARRPGRWAAKLRATVACSQSVNLRVSPTGSFDLGVRLSFQLALDSRRPLGDRHANCAAET